MSKVAETGAFKTELKMELNKLIRTLLATASLGAILALSPVSLDFGNHSGLSFKVSQAFAESGNSGSGGGDDNDSGDDNDDDDNSGQGGGDDSDDDGDDDSSGRDEPRIPGGSGCDDAGDIAEHPECGGAAGGVGGQSEFFLSDGTKVEISNGGLDIEVKYPDGSKEEIQAGRYERKDTNNNTVEERTATEADFARLQALING